MLRCSTRTHRNLVTFSTRSFSIILRSTLYGCGAGAAAACFEARCTMTRSSVGRRRFHALVRWLRTYRRARRLLVIENCALEDAILRSIVVIAIAAMHESYRLYHSAAGLRRLDAAASRPQQTNSPQRASKRLSAQNADMWPLQSTKCEHEHGMLRLWPKFEALQVIEAYNCTDTSSCCCARAKTCHGDY